MHLNVFNAVLLEDAGEDAAPRAVERVDSELELGGADLRDVHELQHGLDVGRLEICFLNPRAIAGRVRVRAQLTFDRLHDRGSGRTAVAGFIFQPIPVPRIVAGGDNHTTDGIEVLHGEGDTGRGDVILRKSHRYTASGD